MIVHEFGAAGAPTLFMFQCAIEPWWAFVPSAKAASKTFHVFLVASDGHDEAGTDFISVEKNVADTIAYLEGHGVEQLDIAYGVSMGGASVMHLLAMHKMPVAKAVVDAGITPYSLPLPVRRLIAVKDYLSIKLGYSSLWAMKKAMPPERWTPAGEDPDEHYRKVYAFGKEHLSGKTVYNSFWSANNYTMPDPVPAVSTQIEYWYGENERDARRDNIAYAKRAFPQIVTREFAGLEHAELVMMFPERFAGEIERFWSARP